MTWASAFAAVYGCFVGLFLTDRIDSTWLPYFGLLFLPQVLSSLAGAFVYSAVLRLVSGGGRRGAVFAAATACVAALVGVLCLFLLLKDRPSGIEFLGWFALVSGIVLVVDVPIACAGGQWVGRLAVRRARRRAERASKLPD